MEIEYSQFALEMFKLKSSRTFKITGSLFLMEIGIHFAILFFQMNFRKSPVIQQKLKLIQKTLFMSLLYTSLSLITSHAWLLVLNLFLFFAYLAHLGYFIWKKEQPIDDVSTYLTAATKIVNFIGFVSVWITWMKYY